jgi:outer membrane protein
VAQLRHCCIRFPKLIATAFPNVARSDRFLTSQGSCGCAGAIEAWEPLPGVGGKAVRQAASRKTGVTAERHSVFWVDLRFGVGLRGRGMPSGGVSKTTCFRSAFGVVFGLAAMFAAATIGSTPAVANETLPGALSSAYATNPTLNAARAEARVVDQQVATALSGWAPNITGDASLGARYQETDPIPSPDTNTAPATMGVTVTQNVFRGFRTVNATKEAEAAVRAAHNSLANTEQNILSQAAEAYADVVRDLAIVQLRRQNIEVLSEQLRATQDRFSVGEVTRTDVAQAEARLSAARFELNAAEAQLLTSRAVYRQIIGREPLRLAPPQPLTALPHTLEQAISIGGQEHPAILAARFAEESAAFAVRVAEGVLLPTFTVEGRIERAMEPSATITRTETAQILGRISIPIYQSGSEYAAIRSAKETRTQRALEIDVAREQVRAAILSAWGGLNAARASIQSAQAQIRATTIALEGVREEARVGQRTTLDVLDAQQELLDAQVALVTAQRDNVVASYALVSAIGRLRAERLALNVRVYEPQQNAAQVRDRWRGLRVPSGQ